MHNSVEKNTETLEDPTKLEVTIFNVAMVDAIKTAYKDPF